MLEAKWAVSIRNQCSVQKRKSEMKIAASKCTLKAIDIRQKAKKRGKWQDVEKNLNWIAPIEETYFSTVATNEYNIKFVDCL